MEINKTLESILLSSYTATQASLKEHRESKTLTASDSLFAASSTKKKLLEFTKSKLLWATDNYTGKDFHQELDETSLVRPRIEKSKEDQKKRTKEKAEVFTPSWVCNLQNNLIDNEAIKPHAFNFEDNETKTWTPNPEKVFNSEEKEEALKYIVSPRLEITCGEGPYLFSPYDTTTGIKMPVKSERGYERIGILDRKLRVVNEIAEDEDSWLLLAEAAVKATYGYEWQGDNLFLARKNFLETYRDYYFDYFQEEPKLTLLKKIAELISWQLWQMDGLKFVLPLSCSEACKACETKDKLNHDGIAPVFKWNEEIVVFEDFLD